MNEITVIIRLDGSIEMNSLEPFNLVPVAQNRVIVTNNKEQQVVVIDERTLTDTAQYNIGWHDGYRAQFNEENTKRHNEAEERMKHNVPLL
jgi:DNA-binding beta-propeller fold protein YncE